jgi:protein O-GlcNAc transferase
MAEAQTIQQRLAAGWKALERDALREAEDIARQVLARRPDEVEATRLLGATLLYQKRYAEALAPLRELHGKAPRRGSGHQLGYCHLALGEFGSAVVVLEREVRDHPDLINARNALGVALVNQGRRDEALPVFLEAACLNPASAESATNAGNVLAELGRYDEAIPHLQRAAQAKPGDADVQFNLGIALQGAKRHLEAIASLQRALDIVPGRPYALGQRLWSEIAICRWAGLDEGAAELRRQLRDARVPAAPFNLVALPSDPAEQRRCAELQVQLSLPAQPAPLWRGERYSHPRLRVAYLSTDFCEHATAYLMAGLFERHDRSRFETVAVSYGADDGSPMRARLRRAFDRFEDVRALSDAQVARRLRDLEIDIAVDLKGHAPGARLGILAHRPAPLQVAYLGYPGTLGAEFIDYAIADRVVLPEAEQACWSEKIVYLPDSYQVNDAGRALPERTMTRAACGLPQDAFVYCCFNSGYKFTPRFFDIWMRLLQAVPRSVLWLLDEGEEPRRNLAREAAARGVDPARLVFAARVPNAEHLSRHALADLFLDTLPCNAHTGASDALWAGLPLLTCAGNTFAGRVAASLLHAAGLPELATRSVADYEALAQELARDHARRRELRARLEDGRARVPLFDTERFRRRLESAYLAMAERQRRGLPPLGFAV